MLQAWITVSSTNVDQLSLVGVGHREELVVHGDVPVGAHSAQYPLPPVVLGGVDRERGAIDGDRRQGEALGGGRHLERLVRAHGVVVGHPGVELGLDLGDRAEGPVGEELLAQALVEPFDLAGRGR